MKTSYDINSVRKQESYAKMDADQRLVALKRAYADIILNTSKEAAARIMVSERKSQRLEHELRVTKDEAIQTMLRLKNMMDEKVSEAKRRSQNQQEKIDELEAQLQEAEDIVSELREKLRYVQAKTERMTGKDVQHLEKHENATHEVVAVEENRQDISQSLSCPVQLQKCSLLASDMEKSYINQRTDYPKCPSQLIEMRNSYSIKPELPSIILRSKKHKIYKNGFTQRIQAYEDVVDNGLSLLRESIGVRHEGKEGEKTDKSKCKATTNGVDKIYNIGSKELMLKDNGVDKMYNLGSKELMLKDRSVICGHQVQATNLISENVKTTPKYKNIKRTLRNKNPDKLFVKVIGYPGDPNSNSVKCNAQADQDTTLTAPKLSSDKTGMATQFECAKTAEMDADNDEGEYPIDIIVPIVQEGISTENTDIQVPKPSLKEINEPVLHFKPRITDATNECPVLPAEKKVVKYTFQRKRKRGTVSISDGNVMAENSTLSRKNEKQIESAPV